MRSSTLSFGGFSVHRLLEHQPQRRPRATAAVDEPRRSGRRLGEVRLRGLQAERRRRPQHDLSRDRAQAMARCTSRSITTAATCTTAARSRAPDGPGRRFLGRRELRRRLERARRIDRVSLVTYPRFVTEPGGDRAPPERPDRRERQRRRAPVGVRRHDARLDRARRVHRGHRRQHGTPTCTGCRTRAAARACTRRGAGGTRPTRRPTAISCTSTATTITGAPGRTTRAPRSRRPAPPS